VQPALFRHQWSRPARRRRRGEVDYLASFDRR
jgi:hypothetical protein